MKYLPAIVFLLATHSFFAQRIPLPDDLFAQSFSTKSVQSRNAAFQLDSILFFRNYTAQDSQKYHIQRFKYEGDTVVVLNDQTLNGNTNTFKDAYRQTFHYDELSRLISTEYGYYNNGVYKALSLFNTFYHGLSYTQFDSLSNYHWKSNGTLIRNRFQTDYNFDNEGNEHSHLEFQYNYNGIQELVTKIETTYTADNKIDSVKYFYMFDTEPFLLKKYILYQHAGDSVTSTIYELNDFDGEWYPERQIVRVYDQAGNKTGEYQYTGGSSTSSWWLWRLDEFTFNEQNQLLTLKIIENNSPAIGLYGDYIYDENGNLKLIESYVLDNSSGEPLFVLDQKIYHYYTETVATGSPAYPTILTIAPNPATDFIIISTMENFDEKTFTIYSTTGVPVLSGKTTANSTLVSIKNLREGMYYLQIDGTASVIKFIKI